MTWICKTVFVLLLPVAFLSPDLMRGQGSTDRMVSGEGFPGFISKWTGPAGPLSHQIANSNLFEDPATRNIGIGTTSPGNLLHLYKDLSIHPKVGITIQGKPISGSGWFIGSSNYSNDYLIISRETNGNDPIVTITNEGAIIIGEDNIPSNLLRIKGEINLQSNLVFKQSMQPKKIIFEDFTMEVWQKAMGSQHKVVQFGSGGLEVINQLKTNTFILSAGAVADYILRCDGSGNAVWTQPDWVRSAGNIYYDKGNVGIGVANPLTKLHVAGNAFFNGKIGVGTSTPLSEIHIKKQTTAGTLGMTIENPEFPWFVGINKGFAGNNSLLVANALAMGSSDTAMLVVTPEGKVGIGVNDPSYTLDVKGNIRATEVKIMHPDDWFDHVFAEDYPLMTLDELRQYVVSRKHLPGVPAEIDVMGEGINLGEFSGLLLQKIEELTLYIIAQDQRIKELESGFKSINQ